jgi:hypothetical protein
MSKVYRTYKKSEIADKMLETALDLYFGNGDGFSIIHLAAAAEEVLAGLLKRGRNRTGQVCTAREKSISALKQLHTIYGSERSEKEIGTSLNYVRNKTKHHDSESDLDQIDACLELEVESVISRAIENYLLYFEVPSEKILRYINHVAQSLHGLTRQSSRPRTSAADFVVPI